MKVSTERLEDCQVNVIIELDAAEAEDRLRQTARKISRQFNVPGYRRGRAPFRAVVRALGREAIQQEALDEFGQELYEKALEEIDEEPYAMGELQEVEWDPFRMTVLLPIQPQVDLGDYHTVRVPYEVEPVTEEQIEQYLAELQEQYAQWVPVSRAAALGDRVVLDIEGKVGDQEIVSEQEHEMLLASDAAYPLPGFHEEIAGMSSGEEKTVSLEVPADDRREEIAGQPATFVVQLHTVKEKDVPQLDDELALMVGDYDTLDDLRAGIRERLETETHQKAEAEYLDKVLEAMVEAAAKIEYPHQAVDREVDLTLDRMERNLASSGISLDAYLGMIGKSREIYTQEIRPAAEERVRKRLVMGEVAKQEGLQVEPEQIESEIDRISDMMGEQAGEMREMLESPVGRMSVADDLIMAQVRERIKQIAKSEALSAEEEPVVPAEEAVPGPEAAVTAEPVEAEAEAAGAIEPARGEEAETVSEEPEAEIETPAETVAPTEPLTAIEEPENGVSP